MKKILIIAATLSLIIISCSIFYYLVIFLPKTYSEKQQFNNEEKIADESKEKVQDYEDKVIECKNLGEKSHAVEIKTFPEGAVALDPIYFYNRKLNKCLYKAGYINSIGSLENGDFSNTDYFYIKDVYTNKNLASYSAEYDDEKYSKMAEWSIREKELMSDN